MDNVIINKYRELACASIVQGIEDWLNNDEASEYDLYEWLQECSWFDYLKIDRDYVYVKVLRLKGKGVKKLKGVKYGKVY